MSFKLRNINEVFGFSKEYSTGDYKVVEKDLGKNTLGTINPNGVIEIEQNSEINTNDRNLPWEKDAHH